MLKIISYFVLFCGLLFGGHQGYLKYFCNPAGSVDVQMVLDYPLSFLPLDYMHQKEITRCKNLYAILFNNRDKMSIIDSKRDVDVPCEKSLFEGLLHKDFSKVYQFYDLKDNGVLVHGIAKNNMVTFKFFNKKYCMWDEVNRAKKLIGSESSSVVEIKGEYYLVSEWFSPDKYVFYYLNKNGKYNEINCRFNLILPEVQ